MDGFLLYCAGLIISAAAAEPATNPLPLLTRVEQIHQLSAQEAEQGYPVRLQGVVTYYDPDWLMLFVQDTTRGIYIYHRGPHLLLKAGETIEVEGISSPGRYSRIVVEPRIKKLNSAAAAFPAPRVVALESIVGGQFDGQYIETIGCVQRASLLEGSYWELQVGAAGKWCKVIVPNVQSKELPANIVDARVRVVGVCGVTADEHFRVIETLVYVHRLQNVQVIEVAPADAFSLPPLAISGLPRLAAQDHTGHRVHVQGVATHQRNDRTYFVQDQTAGIRIETSRAASVQSGDQVEAVGFFDLSGYMPSLREATIRRVAAGPLPLPVALTASAALTGQHHARLIQVDARVLQQSRQRESDVLSCYDGNKIFLAELQRTGETPGLPPLRPNTLLRLSGICLVQSDAAGMPVSFRVLLRSPADLAVLKLPGWWTVGRFAGALGVMSGILLLSAVWIVSLRQHVRAQTVVIEKRLEREAALEEKYRELVENATDIVYATDLTGRFTSVNAAAAKISGYSREEITSMNVVQVVAPECIGLVQRMMARKLAGELPGPYEVEVVTRHGQRLALELSTRLIYQDGQAVGIQGIARDITERRRVEEALRQSEERFSRAFRATPVPIAISRLADGQILDVNESFVALFGFQREELIGKTAVALGIWLKPEDRAQIMHCLESERLVRNVERRLRTKSGQILETLISAEVIELGNERCTLIITHDLTERLHLEHQLRHAQKMEAVGQLAAGIAHDFNNIMTIIQGHTSLLMAETEFGVDSAESLKRVMSASERAANLTRQLLAFSRKQVMRSRRIDLNKVLSVVLKMLQRLLGENIFLECSYGTGLPAISADVSLIEQVIINLALNARDAMPKGGNLSMATSVLELSEVAVQGKAEARAGRFVCLSVADTGCGMDEVTLSKIFEPFFTTKEVGKGTGLGLSMVYGTMKQHRGWVEVASQLGRGTTFNLFFPGESKPPEPSAPRASETRVKSGTETVLVVEDDAALRYLVCSLLRRHGYHVVEAASGREALELWRQQLEEIDLLLTDLMMPGGMSGLDLAEQLQSEKPHLKAIFTSGYSVESASAHIVLQEGINFLAKPYYPPQLAKMVRRVLDQNGQPPAAGRVGSYGNVPG